MSWIAELLKSAAKPFQWWVVIAVWEQGVRVRLGKHSKHLMPGIHFRIPFLDRVVIICTRERMVRADAKTVATSNGKSLTFALSIKYTINNVQTMIESVARPEGTLRELAMAKAVEVISACHSEALSPGFILSSIALELQEKATAWGLVDVEFFVTTFSYARTIRLLQATDYGYTSNFDSDIDDKPARHS